MKFKLLNENGLARIWQHLHNKSTFAIIGSQDKDTREDRSDELIQLVSNLAFKHRDGENKIGYRYLKGRYQYDDGDIGEELSMIVYNISKEQALDIMRQLNQEAIIWKDETFFGFLDSSGKPDGEFSKDVKNMNFSDEDLRLYGSRLLKHKNKNQLKPFKFTMIQDESLKTSTSSIRNLGNVKRTKETLFSLDLNNFDQGEENENIR